MRTLLLLLLVCSSAKADERLAHAAAHIGTSYAITTVAYGTFQALTWPRHIQENPTDPVPSLMLASFTSMFIGFAYKHLEKNVSPTDFSRSMGFNALGTGLGVGAVELFRW